MTFYEAYNFLVKHEIFKNRFLEGLDLMVVKVNPETNCIDDDISKNTKTRVWLEAGPCLHAGRDGIHWGHDVKLDCGGDTFEEAIVKLAKLVKKHYGSRKTQYKGPIKQCTVIF